MNIDWPFGTLIGIINLLTGYMVTRLASRVGFHSDNGKSAYVFLINFFFMFFNTGLLASRVHNGINLGSTTWYMVFGSIISSAIMSTNLLMYFIYMTRKGMLGKDQRSGDTFNIENRSAALLSSLFVVFFYGTGMPYLFIYCWL
jgi:hypothetical protein